MLVHLKSSLQDISTQCGRQNSSGWSSRELSDGPSTSTLPCRTSICGYPSLLPLAPALGLHTTRTPRRRLRATSKQQASCDQHFSLDMAEATGGLSVHLLRNCKIIHLVRHAQGYHNVAGEKDFSAYMSYDYVDASVTPLGWKQVSELRQHLESIDLTSRVELVVTSPLMRTMLTAAGAFGGPQHDDGDPSRPLMVANGGGSGHAAISCSGCPPFMAVELCREHWGLHPCDKRQSISTYRTIFPGIDFSEVDGDEDITWKPDIRETDGALIARGKLFLEWLSKRKEREIAVVSHSGFLIHLFSIFGQDCSAPIQKELRNGFKNCEIRTVVLVNHRELGNSIPEDFIGGTPPGPDVPSEASNKEVVANGQ